MAAVRIDMCWRHRATAPAASTSPVSWPQLQNALPALIRPPGQDGLNRPAFRRMTPARGQFVRWVARSSQNLRSAASMDTCFAALTTLRVAHKLHSHHNGL